MKRTNTKVQLQKRLELVRTTVRELTPAQLAGVAGGGSNTCIGCPDLATRLCTECCVDYSVTP